MPLAHMLRENIVGGLFLDRDGVINAKAPPGRYVTSPDELVLQRGAAAAIRHVNQLSVPVYVVTNQRWVAHRKGGAAQLHRIHQRLRALLGSAGAHVDGIYACVHEINQCGCRKPDRGLVDQILDRHRTLALSSCALVGDAETDIALATRCGMHSVRVYGDEDGAERTRADETATDLHTAVLGTNRQPACAAATFAGPANEEW
jgi:D-glycero-D-manno-heptose 1,7-bisphosphate phosphatase